MPLFRIAADATPPEIKIPEGCNEAFSVPVQMAYEPPFRRWCVAVLPPSIRHKVETGGRRVAAIGFSGGGAGYQGHLSADLTTTTIGGMEPIGKNLSIRFQAATLWYLCQEFYQPRTAFNSPVSNRDKKSPACSHSAATSSPAAGNIRSEYPNQSAFGG